MIDERIAHYHITEKIGAGGMGEVYRATDTKLHREVALKILPEQFATDSQRMGRFQREAEVLASLDHPNIGAIYGVEDVGATKALVLQLVEGPTLAERIAQGPITIDEALPIAVQISEALEAAHERGVVHRDLKPANIKITPEGQVKVLDFGLAKALDTGSDSLQDLTHSPTLTRAATQDGTILGTAGYMSPEQARGQSADQRTDIWAFGCVLFEMLSGERAMAGKSLADTLGAIVAVDPDWSRLPAEVPARIRLLLKRCLRKDPKARLRHIGDARIETLEAGETGSVVPAARPTRLAGFLPWTVAAALAVAAGFGWFRPIPPAGSSESQTARLSLVLDEGAPIVLGSVPSLAISPDGSMIVYAARTESGTQLYRRSLSQYEVTPIPGTAGAGGPFFSPDGNWVGFHSRGSLKKVALAGGSPVALATATPFGADWGSGDDIVFTNRQRGVIVGTTATGTPPEPMTTLNLEEADEAHLQPQLLPGGRAILFVIEAFSLETVRLAVQSIGAGERRVLIDGASWGRYLEAGPGSGWLLFLRSETVFAAPFDLDSLQVTGREMPLIQGIHTTWAWGVPQLAVSSSGVLAYAPSDASANDFRLVWVDRQGNEEVLSAEIRGYEDLHISPDGRYVAFTDEGTTAHVWVHDIGRETAARFVSEGESRDPVWTPDGAFISYGTKRGETFGLHRRRADGSGSEEKLYINDRPRWVDPTCWTPDGRALLFTRSEPSTMDDIWLLPLNDLDNVRPVVQTPAEEWGGKVSPDGRWLAFTSNESGRDEVYVQPFPDGGRRWQVSDGGGRNTDWSPDGRELFYRNGEQMLVVRTGGGPDFNPSRPEVLFQGTYRHTGRDFAVSPDGRRFVMMKPLAAATGTRLNVFTNWLEELNP